MKRTKLQPTPEQLSTKWTGKFQKDILLQKTDILLPHQEVAWTIMWYKQPHTSRVGSPTDWKVTVSQRVIYRRDCSEPQVKSPCLRTWHWEKETQNIWHWRPVGLVHRSTIGLGKMETPFLKGTHRHSYALCPQELQSIHNYLCQTWLHFLGGFPGRNRGWLWLVVGEGIGSKALGNTHQHASLWRCPFWENLAQPISAEKLQPNSSQPHLSVNRLTKESPGTQPL